LLRRKPQQLQACVKTEYYLTNHFSLEMKYVVEPEIRPTFSKPSLLQNTFIVCYSLCSIKLHDTILVILS